VEGVPKFKSRLRDPSPMAFGLILHFFVTLHMQNLKFLASAVPDMERVQKRYPF